jgi:hypothetical protein
MLRSDNDERHALIVGTTAVNEVAEVFDLSTSRKQVTNRSTVEPPVETSSGTLAILPLDAKRPTDAGAWYRARQRLGQLANLAPGWDGMKGVAPDRHTIAFAATELAALERAGVPAPAVHPSADGAVYAEWHTVGIDLELIFEGPYQIIALIEDARGAVPSFEGDDPDLNTSLQALKAIRTR